MIIQRNYKQLIINNKNHNNNYNNNSTLKIKE